MSKIITSSQLGDILENTNVQKVITVWYRTDVETMSVRWRIAGQSDICPILDRYVSDKISVRLNADGQNDIGPMSFTISSRYTRDIGPMMARYRFADWGAIGAIKCHLSHCILSIPLQVLIRAVSAVAWINISSGSKRWIQILIITDSIKNCCFNIGISLWWNAILRANLQGPNSSSYLLPAHVFIICNMTLAGTDVAFQIIWVPFFAPLWLVYIGKNQSVKILGVS